MDEPAARRVLMGGVGDFKEIAKTILCLQRFEQPAVGVVTTFLSDPLIPHVGDANGQPQETELARADRKHHFVSLKKVPGIGFSGRLCSESKLNQVGTQCGQLS